MGEDARDGWRESFSEIERAKIRLVHLREMGDAVWRLIKS